jgi:hypothetical protein
MKEKLTLPGKPNGDPAPVPAKPSKPQRSDGATAVREFQLLDGRPMALHKTVVMFAVPLQTDPEGATVVGIRNAKACPLRVPYPEFLKWWLIK